MKIIQLIQRSQLRGAEIFATQLSQELDKLGHESVIVTVFDGNHMLPFEGRLISLEGSAPKRVRDWKAWKKLAEIVALEKPDVIQANAGDTLKYAVFSKLFFRWRTPIIFRNASTISLYIKSPFSKWWNSFLFHFTRQVISVSEFSKRDFVSVFPHAKYKITVVPIGVTIRPLMLPTIKPLGNPFFLHIGGFSFEKNHNGLIAIFQQLKLKYPDAKLGLIGDGPLRQQIERQVTALGLQESVIFFGYQTDPYKFLREAQCLLLPSVIEGMPAVILESFLCKVPVVAYDVGGVSEIVRPGETGWLVKKHDQEGFVSAAGEVLEDRQKAIEFSENAYRLVNEQFRMDNIAGRFMQVYHSIADENSENQSG